MFCLGNQEQKRGLFRKLTLLKIFYKQLFIKQGGKRMEEYLTAKQVAEYLQVKPLTIYQWAREEKIPAIKIGRIWRFKKEAIDSFLEEQLQVKGSKK